MNSLDLDLRILKSDTRNSLQIFANRAGYIQDNGYLDTKDIYLQSNSYAEINNLLNIVTTVIYSRHPITITAKIGASVTNTVFENQNLWTVSGNLSDIVINNLSGSNTTVKVIRLAQPQIVEAPDLITRQLITFERLSRVAQLPENVVNLNNLRVQNITLVDWTNDQVTAPGIGPNVLNKYRICNSDGSPNATGDYIMILNDFISQENHSGTLQIWVEEIAG